jgi:hypothetical protein
MLNQFNTLQLFPFLCVICYQVLSFEKVIKLMDDPRFTHNNILFIHFYRVMTLYLCTHVLKSCCERNEFSTLFAAEYILHVVTICRLPLDVYRQLLRSHIVQITIADELCAHAVHTRLLRRINSQGKRAMRAHRSSFLHPLEEHSENKILTLAGIEHGLPTMIAWKRRSSTEELARQLKCVHLEHIQYMAEKYQFVGKSANQ